MVQAFVDAFAIGVHVWEADVEVTTLTKKTVAPKNMEARTTGLSRQKVFSAGGFTFLHSSLNVRTSLHQDLHRP